MTLDRMAFKSAALDLFDAVADPHPKGHQGAYAARYVVGAGGPRPLEVMVEKSVKTPLNVWCLGLVANRPEAAGVPKTLRPYAPRDGKPGRHSALTPMTQLAEADLVTFKPATPGDVRAVLDALLAASRGS